MTLNLKSATTTYNLFVRFSYVVKRERGLNRKQTLDHHDTTPQTILIQAKVNSFLVVKSIHSAFPKQPRQDLLLKTRKG